MANGDGGRVYSVEERLARFEVMLSNNAAAMGRLDATVEALERKIDGRPSWAVVWMILALQATCGVLASMVALLMVTR